jgi:hypothetical protein
MNISQWTLPNAVALLLLVVMLAQCDDTNAVSHKYEMAARVDQATLDEFATDLAQRVRLALAARRKESGGIAIVQQKSQTKSYALTTTQLKPMQRRLSISERRERGPKCRVSGVQCQVPVYGAMVDAECTSTGASKLSMRYNFDFNRELADFALASLFERNATVVAMVAGFGCYSSYWLTSDRLAEVRAVDGMHGVHAHTHGFVDELDAVTKSIDLGAYDWAVSLRAAGVARESAAAPTLLLDNLARHARRGVVLSWPPASNVTASSEGIVKLMRRRGFTVDASATQQASSSSQGDPVCVFRRRSHRKQ